MPFVAMAGTLLKLARTSPRLCSDGLSGVETEAGDCVGLEKSEALSVRASHEKCEKELM